MEHFLAMKKKIEITDTCYNMNEPQMNIMWNNRRHMQKKYILSGSINRKGKKSKN